MGYNKGDMFIFLIILIVITFVVLLIVTAIQPIRSKYSLFELARRADLGYKDAKLNLEREKLSSDILSLQRVVSSLLLVIVVSLVVGTFGWFNGVLLALFITLSYGTISNIGFIKGLSKKMYGRIEKPILNFIQKAPIIINLLRSVPRSDDGRDNRVDSREELQHLISNSDGVLSVDERKLIVHSLSFDTQLVSAVMTPRSMIASIKKTDFLGPLTLSDLHKTGHSRLPVIDEDIDHIVGILHISSLLALDIKDSTTAEKTMEPKVFYIREDQNLRHALAAFLRTRHHLFVVVNEFRETVGLLSLEDVIEALIGQKIVDEFDKHDDLRAVALRNPGSNNKPEKCQNV